MECVKCKYYAKSNLGGVHTITSRYFTKSCTIPSDENVDKLHICFNCKHWIGGGDYGLSCTENYHSTNTNGFEVACEKFKHR